MKTRELIRYCRRRINGHRRQLLLICMLPIGAELLFRALEAALYTLLLYFGEIEPITLFTGENSGLLMISVCFAFIRLTLCPPLWCAAAQRLAEFTEDKMPTPFSAMLLSGRYIRRSITAAFLGRLICGLALLPGIISAAYAAQLLSKGADSSGLFAASNAVALTGASVLFRLYIRLSLTAVPWILAEYPERGGIFAVFESFRFMRNRRGLPLKLAFAYFFPAVTVIGIPFLLPELAASFSQGIAIFRQEDEYAGRTVIRIADRKCPQNLRR